MNSPPVDIIIVNYNSGSCISKTLPAILKTDYENKRIIIVDNNSSDESLSYLKSLPLDGKVSVLYLDKNYGFAGAINKAIPLCHGDYIATLNEDILPDPNWLKESLKTFNRYPDTGVVMSCLIHPDTKKPEYNTPYWNKPLCVWSGKYSPGLPSDSEIVYSGLGGCVIRGDLFNYTRLNENFFLYFEDVDYSLKVKAKGYTIRACINSILYHYSGISVKRNIPKKELERIFERNRLALFFIHYPLKDILIYSPFVFGVTFYKILKRLLLFQFTNAYYVLLSFPALYNSLEWIITERKNIEKEAIK